MTLVDFFTLTEMNHGLTSPSRVMELVAVMQKERIGNVNVGDVTRQWSAVASAITATENKDCLDLFIQLDGVQFIDKWLKDAQRFNNDSGKSFPEETIVHLLQALETLHMSYEKLVASEIWVTVKDLLIHGSSKVQDKARVLFESWKSKGDDVDPISVVEKVGALANDEIDKSENVQRGSGCSKLPVRYSSPFKDFSGVERGQESTTDEQVPPTVSEALHPGPVVRACNSKILDTSIGVDRASDQAGAPLSKPALDSPMRQIIDTTLVESCAPAVLRQDKHDGVAEFPKLQSTGDLMHTPKIERSYEKLVSLEGSKKSEAADANKSIKVHENNNSCGSGPIFIDSKKVDSGGADAMDSKEVDSCGTDANDDGSYENNCRSSSLDISCQVAIEVERESVDANDKSFCSEISQPDSLDLVSVNQSHDNEGSHNEVVNIPELSAEASPMQQLATCIEYTGTTQTSSTKDMETTQVTEVAHEDSNAEKGPFKFDLNQEVCSDDIDRPGNQTGTTTSIISDIRGDATPGLPVSPSLFEENLGQKGSADKSVFSPASPRGCHEIDLNVAESGDGHARDLVQYKQVHLYSGLPPGESSLGTELRKYERLDLDLNLASEDDGVPSDWRIGQLFPPENDFQHQSYSSPVSTKQPLRIIDLNDQPSFRSDPYDNSCSSNVNVSGGTVADESMISIMGSRVKVNHKDLVPQMIPLPNGQTPELTFDVISVRTENCFVIGSDLPYAHSSVYGYNNVAPVLAVSASPSSIYGYGGAIPYMAESRGSPVIPQIVGSAFSQPPTVLNMMSSTSSIQAGPSGSSFDLNTGTIVEGGAREPAVLRDFLNLGIARSMDDQLRANTLATVSSVINGKRKAPDNDLELHPFRNYTPPWK